MEFIVEPIGVIHTPYVEKESTPIQGVFRPDVEGTVEVFLAYAEGLQDIETFTHLTLIYRFDKACPPESIRMVRPMLMDDTPHGVLASRNPCRPNFLGMTCVRLLGRNGSKLKVSGVDMLDGTPLLDIKPYVPRFDSRPEAGEGWFEGKQNRPKPCGRE